MSIWRKKSLYCQLQLKSQFSTLSLSHQTKIFPIWNLHKMYELNIKKLNTQNIYSSVTVHLAQRYQGHCQSIAMSFMQYSFCNSFRHGLLSIGPFKIFKDQKINKLLILINRPGVWSLLSALRQFVVGRRIIEI